MPCIFRLSKYLKYNMVENDVFERSAAWQKRGEPWSFPLDCCADRRQRSANVIRTYIYIEAQASTPA